MIINTACLRIKSYENENKDLKAKLIKCILKKSIKLH